MNRFAIIVVLAGLWMTTLRVSAAEKSPPDFRHEIVPLLKNRCVRCHGPAEKKAELNLALPTGIARGGENGRIIVPGKPEESTLWQRVAADEMPEDEPLPAEEKELLRRWIAAGAGGLPEKVSEKPDGDEHWAFQKLKPASAPEVRDPSRIRTPIDRFIQKELEAHELAIGPETDRHTLIRRVAFDLTGLPPTPEEIEAFVNDPTGNAYEQMVDRYLASPRYGERWGKFWLDAAGYADSNGYFGADTDRPLAYRYRDYVIRSINADKPWDQFIREQLAGDELAGYKPADGVTPEMVDLLEATHYLRNSPDGTDSSDGNPDELRADKYAVLEGTMQIMGASLLGMTVQCAKCHDHKFEPFTQRDFYSLQAVIYPAFNVEKWVKPKDREMLTATSEEIATREKKVQEIDEQIAKRREQFRAWFRENRERGQVLFQDSFDGADRKLAEVWTNVVPGDEAPAGQPAVNIDSPTAPGAQIADENLRIVESRDDGDRAFSTKQTFDWTPNEKDAWVQVTFDLLPGKDTAPYVGYLIALRDFNDTRGLVGGNVLVDGAQSGKASVHVDYPGDDSDRRGEIGASGYQPGRNYGVRITNRGEGKYELAQVVDGVVEDGTVTLSADDLPDGGFGFEYCCGRSFAVDNVLIEASDSSPESEPQRQQLAEMHRREREALEADVKALEAKKPGKPGRLAAVADLSAEPPEVFLMERGDYKSPKEKVEAAGPAVLANGARVASKGSGVGAVEGAPTDSSRFRHRLPTPFASTGSRLSFARWLTEPESRASALLARVTVNRFWQHHFGAGIVATPENLGYSGAPPTHPELLEYLAAEFVRSGWSAKTIHRMILNSAAYRQSSRPIESGATDERGATDQRSLSVSQQVDPDNHLLSRFPLRRMDAEAIRDGMLAGSGELDFKIGGPYVLTKRDDEGDVIVDETTAGALRRSVYLQQRRTQVTGLLEVFDAPSVVFSCTFRTPTTVPLQSLKLLNSSFVRARAEALAKRIETEADQDFEARIHRAFLLTCARAPTAAELASAKEFIAQQPTQYPDTVQESGVRSQESWKRSADALAWIDFCHMLLSSNTFLYVE